MFPQFLSFSLSPQLGLLGDIHPATLSRQALPPPSCSRLSAPCTFSLILLTLTRINYSHHSDFSSGLLQTLSSLLHKTVPVFSENGFCLVVNLGDGNITLSADPNQKNRKVTKASLHLVRETGGHQHVPPYLLSTPGTGPVSKCGWLP